MTDDSQHGGPSNESSSEESSGPDDLDVPESPPDPESAEHVLPPEDLEYPIFEFESEPDDRSQDAAFDHRRDLDAETMAEWLDSLAGALISHDLAVEDEDVRTTFGVRPSDVRMRFDPEEDRRGTLEVTLSLDAMVLRREDTSRRPTGTRGGRGFVPLEMLTGDRDPSEFRCYNWVDEPGVESTDADDDRE